MTCGVVTVAGVRVERNTSPHAIPGHVDAAIFPNRELSAANGAHGHRGMRFRINSQRFGKISLTGLTSDVKDIATRRITLVINKVDDAFAIDGGLRLNTAVGSREQTDLWRRLPMRRGV